MPKSGDLDLSVSVFEAAPKYLSHGWQTYMAARPGLDVTPQTRPAACRPLPAPTMTTEEFVLAFYQQKQLSLQFYLDRLAQVDGVAAMQTIQLVDGQQITVQQLLDNVLSDTLYTVLLGLAGSASIGGQQTRYNLRDSAGNSLNDGDLGGYAWQYFQNDGEEPS